MKGSQIKAWAPKADRQTALQEAGGKRKVARPRVETEQTGVFATFSFPFFFFLSAYRSARLVYCSADLHTIVFA